MKRTILLLLPFLFLVSCNKEKENIIWEKSFASGKAVSVINVGDSGYASCGESDGKPYLLFINSEKNTVFDFKSDKNGIFSSVLAGESHLLAAGSSSGSMYLAGFDFSGNLAWDTTFTTSYRIDHSSLKKLDDGSYIALGTADPDSTIINSSGIIFIRFLETGLINSKKEITAITFTAAKSFAVGAAGDYYLAMTKMGSGGKAKATVAKYNTLFQKLWEKDLYNNPSFGAASLGIVLDEDQNPVVCGRTELQVSSGKANNAFVARYIPGLDSLKGKYLEYTNIGSAIIFDSKGEVAVLNMKCLVINTFDNDLEISGIIRAYKSCDPKASDSEGLSMALTPEGNIIIAGTKGKGFYLIIKSSEALSPV